jgi:TolB protein
MKKSRTRVAIGLLAGAVAWAVLAAPASAAFWGRNGKISFWGNDGGGPAQIYVMNPDGSGKTNLSNTSSFTDGFGRWSRDGRQLVFSRTDASAPFGTTTFDIYTMAADGSGVTRLTNETSYQDLFPAWTAGGQIVFQRAPIGDPGWGECPIHSALWVMNADGTGAYQLTPSSMTACVAATSPFGGWVVFTGSTDGDASLQLFVIKLNGAGLRQLSPAGTTFDFRPNWSPDGTRILFLNGPAPSHSNLSVWTVSLIGGHRSQVLGSVPSWDAPVYSPDGRFIALHTCDGGCRIFIAHNDGTGLTQLTFPGPGQFDANVDWQPLRFF